MGSRLRTGDRLRSGSHEVKTDTRNPGVVPTFLRFIPNSRRRRPQLFPMLTRTRHRRTSFSMGIAAALGSLTLTVLVSGALDAPTAGARAEHESPWPRSRRCWPGRRVHSGRRQATARSVWRAATSNRRSWATTRNPASPLTPVPISPIPSCSRRVTSTSSRPRTRTTPTFRCTRARWWVAGDPRSTRSPTCRPGPYPTSPGPLTWPSSAITPCSTSRRSWPASRRRRCASATPTAHRSPLPTCPRQPRSSASRRSGARSSRASSWTATGSPTCSGNPTRTPGPTRRVCPP